MQESQDLMTAILARLPKFGGRLAIRVYAEPTELDLLLCFQLKTDKEKLMGLEVHLRGKSDDENRYRVERALDELERVLANNVAC